MGHYGSGLWAAARRVFTGRTAGHVSPAVHPRRGRRRWARTAFIASAASSSVIASLLGATAQGASATGSPAQLVFTTQPGDGSPGTALASQPVVTIEDGSNSTVDTSSTVSLTLTGPGGAAQTGFPATLTCNANSVPASHGVATFTGCAIDRGGLFTITATDAADNNLTTFSQQVFISGPAQLAFTGEPGGGTATQAWLEQPQVTVEDAEGSAITTSTSDIQLGIAPLTGAAGAALTCANNLVAASSGVATFSGCAIDKAGTSYELVATDGTDLLSLTSSPFDITVGTAYQVVFTQQPTSSVGGQVFSSQPQVTVEDAGGNAVTGNSDQVSLGITGGTSGATLSCAQNDNTATAVNGVATFSGCSVNDAGNGYQLVATDSAPSLQAESNKFDISVGGAENISFAMEPSGGAGGAAFGTQPEVSLTDSGGNPVPGSVMLSIDPGTGTPGATLTCGINPLGVSNGDALFSGCSINLAGTGYVLEAQSGALTAYSSPFDITGGTVAKASFFVEPGNGSGGSALSTQPVVTLADSGGNPAAGSVTLSLLPGLGTPGAKLTCAQNPVVASGGTAKFSDCSVDQAGTGYELVATIGTVTAQSASFNVSVGAPAQLAFTQQPSGGTGGATWTGQPTVVIEDAGGNQVTTDTSSVSLSITPGTGNGQLSCTASTLPAVLGSANFSGCRTDKTALAYTLTATDTADGINAESAPFAVTVGAPAQLVFVGQPSGSTAATVWPGQPQVAVTDAGGNTVTSSDASIALSLTPGTGTSGASLACASNALAASDGVASFSGCSVNKAAGGYTLTATDSADSLKMESQPFSVLLPPPGPLEVAPTPTPLAQTFGGRNYGANPTNVTDDVNTATGALTFSNSDLTVAGIGEPLDLVRTYNSDDTTGGTFGPGWTSILDLTVRISANHSTATVRGEDGQQIVFKWNPFASTWSAPPGAKASLNCNTNTCTVARFDGTRWDTTSGGQLRDYLAPDGQGLTFAYKPGVVAVTVETTNRAPLVVDAFLNAAGEVTKVTTPTRQVSYGYTGGLLSSFTDADGNTWTYSYTSGGLLTTITDPLGNVRLAVAYGPSGRVVSEQQEGSPQLSDSTFGWNAATQTSTQTVQTSVGGAVKPETYTDQYIGNDLVAQTSPTGSIMRYSYDSQVNLTEVQGPLGWVQTMAYDSANNLIAQITPISSTSAAVVRMTYDPFHRLLTQTDADGNTTTYVYNGPLLRFVLPPGAALGTTYSYNGVGELTLVDSPIGQQAISYDAAGNQTGLVLETFGGQSLNGRGTLSTYNEAGQITSLVDPRGNLPTGTNTAYETTWTYDADGNLLSHTTPGPQTTTYSYDAAGDLSQVQAPNGTVTSYAWDQAALARSITTGATTSTDTYDPSGNLLAETSATGQNTTYAYDSGGREVSTTGPNAVTVNFTYDIQGDAIGVTDSAGNTITREYDAMSRPIRTVNNGAATLDSYDPAGNVVSTTGPSGAVTTTSYNSFGKVASVTNSTGTTFYRYDQAGDLTSVTDPDGYTTTYAYDAAAREVASTVNGATTTYGYDLAGNVDSVTDPDGRVTTYTLNAENQPTKTVYSWTGHPTETVTEQYNAAGERSQMVDPNGTVHNYTYDSAGDLTSASSGPNTFTYSYSTPGEIVETYPDGTSITYAIDDDNNLMSVQVGQPGDTDYAKAAYILNADRQATGIAFSNGVLETDQLNTQGEVLNQTLQLAGTTLASDTFTYDGAGNRLSQVDNVGGTATTNQYGYDGAERLASFSSSTGPAPLATASPATASPAVASPAVATPGGNAGGPVATFAGTAGSGSSAAGAMPAALAQAGDTPLFSPSQTPPSSSLPTSAGSSTTSADPSYTYDYDGNQLTYTTGTGTTTYTYNAADEIAFETGPAGRTTWSYDRNGDVTKIAGPTTTQTFTYDAADHLVGVTTVSGANTTNVSYTYDGDGNRTSETVGPTTTQFVWDPFGQYPQLALEENGSGGLIARFIYGNGPVAMQTPTQTYFYHLDPQGSVAEMTNSAGAVAAAYTYDGYGNVTTTGTTPPANPLLFQGQFYDTATGLYYMRARNYDPTTGRFTQRDPATETVGTPFVSPYVFANDRPTFLTDPTGDNATTTALFESHNTTAANAGQDTKDGILVLGVGLKVLSKLGGYSSAVEEAALASKVGIELDPATASLAEAGDAISVGGKALSVIGIGLQTFITVEDCLHGTVQQCVGDAVGTAVNIAFTVGCAVATAGVGAVACGVVGAAIGVGLQYVITNFGPQIVAGLISVSDAVAQGVSEIAEETGQGLIQAGNDIVGIALAAGGVIATGINEATTAISSGLQTALGTLVQAGYTAVQIAGVLANTFKEGIDEAVAGLVSLGYGIVDLTKALASVFSQTAAQIAQVLKDAFNYAATAVAGALQTVFSLGEQAVASILQGVNYAVDQVASALETVFSDTAAGVATVLNDIGYGVEQIGAALQQVFAEADNFAAQILAGLGYGADLIAGALQTLYSDADLAVATALQFAGFVASAVAGALSMVFNDAAEAVAAVLNDLAYAVNDIASALNTVFGLASQAVAQVLDDIGVAVDAIAGALKTVFGLADEAVAAVLGAISVAVDAIATALKDVFNDVDSAVATALQLAGFVASQIAGALLDVFSDAAAVVAGILNGLAFTVDDIASALSTVFSLVTEAVAGILNGIGIPVNAIAQALADVFGDTAQAAAQVLEDIGIGVDAIATALEDIFNEAANAAAQILQGIGEAASAIAQALYDVFNLAASAIGNLLSDLGYAASVIQGIASEIGGALGAALSSLESFGQSVANCFSSFFTDC
jgi:RHS repeat-associated protein